MCNLVSFFSQCVVYAWRKKMGVCKLIILFYTFMISQGFKVLHNMKLPNQLYQLHKLRIFDWTFNIFGN